MWKTFLKRKWMFGIGLFFVLSTGYMIFSGGEEEGKYELAKVDYVDITQAVSVTGTIEAETKINLRFQKVGQVNDVLVGVGDFVKKGDVLAKLDSTALAIDVQSAEANLALANANYNQAVAGSTQEAIQVADAALQKAEADVDQAHKNLASVKELSAERVHGAELDFDTATTNLDNAMAIYGADLISAYEDLYNEIEDSLNEMDDTLREVDSILGVDDDDVSADFGKAFSALDPSKFSGLKSLYKDSRDEYAALIQRASAVNEEDHDVLDAFVSDVKALLRQMNDLVNDTDDLLTVSPTVGSFTSTIRSTKRSVMAVELSNLTTASIGLSNATQAVQVAATNEETKLSSARDALAEIEQSLSQARVQANADVDAAEALVFVNEALLLQKQAALAEIKVGPRSVDLASLSASIDSAAASLRLAQYNLSLGSLKAPISGIITKVYFDVGENVNTTDVFLEMVSQDYQVIANVSESDIAKVKLGDLVTMTLDAFYYDKVFDAEIVEIEPAETIVQGVIYYQITAGFTAKDSEVKPGMTANMDIITAETENILAVPVRAVKYDGSRTYVLQPGLVPEELIELDVEVGIRGDQYIEILAGLEEGDEVVTYVR